MKIRRLCPDDQATDRARYARRRRPCELERGQPCRCVGGPATVVDLDGDERRLCGKDDRS